MKNKELKDYIIQCHKSITEQRGQTLKSLYEHKEKFKKFSDDGDKILGQFDNDLHMLQLVLEAL